MKKREFTGTASYIVAGIAIFLSLYVVWHAATLGHSYMQQRAMITGIGLMLCFLFYPLGERFRGKKSMAMDFIFLLCALVPCIYMVIYFYDIAVRVAFPTTMDRVMSIMLVISVLEGTRRILGITLPIICLVFILYFFLGQYVPGLLGHAGLSLDRFTNMQYMYTEGVFGMPIGAVTTFVFILIVFGAFFQAVGGGDFIVNLATSLLGWARGGPAKVAVIASGFFGMLSGSVVANVATTGAVTIPLMKRVGYRPDFAGAVEACASTGGAFMPPIMGAAAFIMADILGIPYIEVCIAAAIPAVLYYVVLLFGVDYEAARTGLKGIPREELPSFKKTLIGGFHFFVPLIVLVYMLVMRYSPARAGFYAIVATVAIWFLKGVVTRSRLDFRSILRALENATHSSLVVITACAAAGIVIGVVNATGLGLRFTGALIDLSQGILPLLLVLTMIASIVLGMGLPITACYVIVGILVAPALVEMGIPPIGAHLFAFYFGIISCITPPVAVAAYTAAGIAGSNPMTTSFTAWRIGLVAFILPFIFIYNPELLMIGSPASVALAVFSAGLGAVLFATVIHGYLLGVGKVNIVQRIVTGGSAVAFLIPGWFSDLIGLGLLALVVLVGRLVGRGIHSTEKK